MQETPKPHVDEDRAALMRRIAALALVEDEAVLQQMRQQEGTQQSAPAAFCPAPLKVALMHVPCLSLATRSLQGLTRPLQLSQISDTTYSTTAFTKSNSTLDA